jgi:hypothetical protein
LGDLSAASDNESDVGMRWEQRGDGYFSMLDVCNVAVSIFCFVEKRVTCCRTGLQLVDVGCVDLYGVDVVL